MGQNPYPVEIASTGGGPVKIAGDLTFTDAGNQPGGSVPAQNVGQAEYDYTVSGTVSPAAPVTFVFSDGDATMLDLSTPTMPVPVEDGIYAVEATVVMLTATGATMRLHTDDDFYSIDSGLVLAAGGPTALPPLTALPWFWGAGSGLQLFAETDGDISGRIFVQKIA